MKTPDRPSIPLPEPDWPGATWDVVGDLADDMARIVAGVKAGEIEARKACKRINLNMSQIKYILEVVEGGR